MVQMSSSPNPQSDADQLEAAADRAIAARGGDAREACLRRAVANSREGPTAMMMVQAPQAV